MRNALLGMGVTAVTPPVTARFSIVSRCRDYIARVPSFPPVVPQPVSDRSLPMSRIATLAGLALMSIAGAAAMASPAAAKACVSGICAESRTDGKMVNVYLNFNGKNYSHFNVRRNGGQLEVKPGQVYLFGYKEGYK